jgi:hypothetical protein
MITNTLGTNGLKPTSTSIEDVAGGVLARRRLSEPGGYKVRDRIDVIVTPGRVINPTDSSYVDPALESISGWRRQ